MSVAHPWLAQKPWPTTELPQPELRARIERLLTMANMCVLATTGRYGAVATPIEYYAHGLDLYMYPQPGSAKIRNIERDPRVCAAVHMPYVGWASARGCQVFGEAELFEQGSREHEHGLDVFRWEASAAELNRPQDRPPEGIVLRLRADRIWYTEHWLRKDGYAPRQVWRRRLDPEA